MQVKHLTSHSVHEAAVSSKYLSMQGQAFELFTLNLRESQVTHESAVVMHVKHLMSQIVQDDAVTSKYPSMQGQAFALFALNLAESQ